MKIGIGLPAAIPGVGGDLILDWARRADESSFSSLGLIDRVVYPNYEPMVTLAAAAAVTVRVRLMTMVLLAPLRTTGVLAKQAASLDALSGGRFTLGLGIGRRPDDFQAAPGQLKGRGKRFEEQLALMKRIWAGEPVGEGVGPVGPPPVRRGGPELLIGGTAPEAVARVGRWADGYVASGTDAEQVRGLYRIAQESWAAEGRSGAPRLVGGAYFALGPGAAERGAETVRDYYRFMGPAADQMTGAALSFPEAVRGALQALSEIGMDELVLWPSVPELDQVARLAEVAL